jgi:hypothetical protein
VIFKRALVERWKRNDGKEKYLLWFTCVTIRILNRTTLLVRNTRRLFA